MDIVQVWKAKGNLFTIGGDMPTYGRSQFRDFTHFVSCMSQREQMSDEWRIIPDPPVSRNTVIRAPFGGKMTLKVDYLGFYPNNTIDIPEGAEIIMKWKV